MVNQKPIYGVAELRDEGSKAADTDDSDDNASEDNLQERDLYQQVYMINKTNVSQQMRQTAHAQKSFLNEVKIFIKQKKDVIEEDFEFLEQTPDGEKNDADKAGDDDEDDDDFNNI